MLAELANLESLEEPMFWMGCCMQEKSYVEEKLLHIYEEEERFWHKRFGERWLLQGDADTEFFHKIANGRARKKMLYTMKNGNEVLQ